MNYLFSIFIILFITGLIFKKYRKTSLIGLLIIFLVLLTLYPKEAIVSSTAGINLWLFVVLPSLFPFFIINDILISLEVPNNIAQLLAPITRFLFKTSGYGAYCFIMSVFSGYPTGAKIVSELIEKKLISLNEGQKILCFSSTSGPLFIIGAVGAGMMNNVTVGYIIFLCHVLGAILNGVFFSFILKSGQTIMPLKLSIAAPDAMKSKNALTYALVSSLKTSGFIGGYIVLFSVLIALLEKIGLFNCFFRAFSLLFPTNLANTISLMLKAVLEISNGCKIITMQSISLDLKMIFISFIISLSGLSIIGQVQSVLTNTKINIKLYIFSKLSHGLISGIICYIFLHLNIVSYETFSLLNINNMDLYIISSLLLLTLLMLLNTLVNLKNIKRK